MTVNAYLESQKLSVLTLGDVEREITGGYCGDLLSWVMSRATSGDCWFTVMGNINCVAVAVLADCACIVLCESACLDDDAKLRAEQQGITILSSPQNAYELSVDLGKLL